MRILVANDGFNDAGGVQAYLDAVHLFISHRTVQNHVQNTLIKLQMHNRVELVRFAIAKGLDIPT